jgi:hypothetical protein
LLSCCGSEVVLQVVALDSNDHVIAAQVRAKGDVMVWSGGECAGPRFVPCVRTRQGYTGLRQE